MTKLIVHKTNPIQKETQSKANQILALIRDDDTVSNDGLFSDAVSPGRVDWFVQTELYRLGLRRKEGGE